MSAEITVAALLELIDGIDAVDPNSYLDLFRFSERGSGESDMEMTALVRRLARERLGSYELEDVGIEVLRRIDRRAAE